MNKYTIVYTEHYGYGLKRISLVRYEHVTTDNLTEYLESRDFSEGSIWFVFEGHVTHVDV